MQMTLPEFEEEEVPDLLQIYEFDTEQERGEYILQVGSNETKRKYQRSLVIQSLADSEISAREGRFDQAEKILEDALQVFPERGREIAGRGEDFTLFPSNFLAEHPTRGYVLLARLAKKAGEKKRAREYRMRIEELDPRGPG
jgi:tetratricopeptide (TPR) repeat protein